MRFLYCSMFFFLAPFSWAIASAPDIPREDYAKLQGFLLKGIEVAGLSDKFEQPKNEPIKSGEEIGIYLQKLAQLPKSERLAKATEIHEPLINVMLFVAANARTTEEAKALMKKFIEHLKRFRSSLQRESNSATYVALSVEIMGHFTNQVDGILEAEINIAASLRKCIELVRNDRISFDITQVGGNTLVLIGQQKERLKAMQQN